MSGSAAARARLYVADQVGKRILVFRLPGLELLSSWEHVCEGPRRLAVDRLGRIYVLDATLLKLLRLDSSGQTDPSYDTSKMAGDAMDLFVSADGAAFVSVVGADDILCFSPTGTRLDPLRPPDEAPGFLPAALAGDASRLYVADRKSGRLWVYDLGAGAWLSSVPHFRAPVAGLATDGGGHLYVRTGADTTYRRLDASSAHVSLGFLEAGPFDAGEQCAWMRVHADADEPEGTRVRIKTALAARSDAVPVWKPAPSLDSLVHPPAPAGMTPDPAARFLWIRADLETDDPRRSPRLRQIVAETPGEDYLAKLPAVYARKDAEAGGFLRTFLEAFRAELGDRELEIASLAQRLDPATAPADHLEWLASWAAFDLPPDAHTAERRKLLLDAPRLYERRGTVQGLREMVRTYTGVDCEIVETFRSRRLWVLRAELEALGGARLGFDTGLLPALPDGMVVPGPSLPEPSLQGLRAEYFLDDRLGTSAATPDRGGDRCERRSAEPPLIEPDGQFPFFKVPVAPADKALEAFSALWTGQVRARYSEVYSFYFAHDGGARLYVDNQLLIDSWITPGNREPRGSLPLNAERWYVVRIEYWTDELNAKAPKLSWSSRSQPKEIVPQECLYADSDDNINPGARRTDGGLEPMVVGETVVGAHGPLAAEDFGAPLFDDTAHRFTVRVNAAQVRDAGKLETIRAVLDAEKPAHTDYHLCLIEPTFLVGTQARVGIDAFVAPALAPGRYDEGRLGLDTRLGISAEHDDGTLRVDETIRIGSTAILR
jgi:phage tail-like protein